jgi:two-component system, NtrC family, sensor kinase
MQRRPPLRTALLRFRNGIVAESQSISLRGETRRRGFLARFDDAPTRAELIAVGWEFFSAMLFVSAVVPAAFDTGLVELIFVGSMVLSAVVARPLLGLGVRGYAWAGALRALAWPLSVAPLVGVEGPQVFIAALAFGLMAGGMRRAVYRRFCDTPLSVLSPEKIRSSLRARLAETAMTAGIVGGHIMLLFSVAFLRTQSRVIYRLWFEIVPALALIGTVAFTLAVIPATKDIIEALGSMSGDPRARSSDGGADADLFRRATKQAQKLPDTLAYLNFGVWFACTAFGVFYVRPGPAAWKVGDAVMQLGFGSLFAWGVAFYQRLWNRDLVAPVLWHLRRFAAGESVAPPANEPLPLRARMLRDFGLPLVFMAVLSLLSSIGLYRTLATELTLREDFNAVTALFSSFAILLLALGGLVMRAARDLSRPMAELAGAADRIASGKLEAAVPPVAAPVEVVGLGESIERMRQALAHTIVELEVERAGLEEKVEARTAELRRALEELKQAQAALVQGERLATIGELVSGVAHEINNPLNAIAGASVPLEELVADLRQILDAYRAVEKDLPPARRVELERLRSQLDLEASLDDLVGISSVIRRATDRSVRIVTNLRNFSRTSAEAVPTDLHACVEETLMLLAPRLRQANIAIDKSFAELPLVVCRAGEMNQIFMNLLVNAVQALEQSAPAEPQIRIESFVDGDSACVAVSDNGPGVPGDIVDRVFDPFFTTKPRGQGTGLGLSISTDIARRHGGSLALEPTLGKPRGPVETGARFVCRLPIRGLRREKGAVTPRASG